MTTFKSVVAASAVLLMGLAAAITAPSAQAEQVVLTPIERFSSCLASQGGGDMVLLFDESRSLLTTDRDNGRVVAGRYLVNRLAEMADRSDFDLQVMVSGFGTSFRGYESQWTSAADGGTDDLLAKVSDFTERNNDTGTDYWLGLEGARQALSERRKSDGRNCQAIFFFSDGELDVSLSPDEEKNGRADDDKRRPYAPDNDLSTRDKQREATAAASESLCRSGGLVDQIRLQDIITFGVGLSGEDEDPETQFDLMRRAVTGQGGSGVCGDIQSPVPGHFTSAGDIDELLFAFDAVTRDRPVDEKPICQGAVCPDGTHQLVLDATVSRIEMFGSAEADGIEIFVTAPDGSLKELTRSTLEESQKLDLPGATGGYKWLTSRSVSLQLGATDLDAWTGVWTITFVDPASSSSGKKARTSVSVTGDLRPQWLKDDEMRFRVGESYPLNFGLVGLGDRAVDPASLLGKAALAVSVLQPDGSSAALSSLEGVDIGSPVDLDTIGLAPGDHTLRMRLNVTTADVVAPDGSVIPGTELVPQAVDVPFTVEPPLGYPRVDASVDFGSAEGEPALKSVLPIEGPGCVWLHGATALQASPDGVTQVAVSSESSGKETCLSVEEGSSTDLAVQLQSAQSGNGSLQGSFEVRMVPLEGGDERSATVRFTAELTKDLNPTPFWVVLVLAMILGPGIPILLAYLLKYLLASKIPAGGINAPLIPLTIENGEVRRDGMALSWRPEDNREFLSVANSGSRRLTVGDVVLRSKLGASPFGAGHVSVTAPGRVAVSGHDPRSHGKTHSARLPLAVQNQWVLLVDPHIPDRAELLVLLAPTTSRAQRERLLDDAASRVPKLVADNAARVDADAASTAEPGNAFFEGAAAGGVSDPYDFFDTDATVDASEDTDSGNRFRADDNAPITDDEKPNDEKTNGSWDPFTD